MRLKLFEQYNNDKSLVCIDFPELRQTYNFDCGASALQQVLCYYGVEEREDNLMKQLKTVTTEQQEHGTKLSNLKKVAEYYGLDAEVKKNMKIDDLKKLIDDKTPVILLIQAWRDFSVNKEWKKDFSDGHYVSCIGYDDRCLYFEDPSSFTRTYLSYEELEERWHDVDDDNKTKIYNTGVIIYGVPRFKKDIFVHMD